MEENKQKKYLLDDFEQSSCLKKFSIEEKEAFEKYVLAHPELIPGEIVFMINEWEKFQDYFQNEFLSKKRTVDVLIEGASSRIQSDIHPKNVMEQGIDKER